jgi:hypothetical protein
MGVKINPFTGKLDLVGNGPQGSQGNQGLQGSQGFQGNQGNIGPQGDQGNQGDQGSGSQGDQGSQGSQGNQGTTGSGTQGNQGDQGDQGGEGSQGDQGDQGDIGPQGDQGEVGEGTQGNQGSQGEVGEGTQGNQGDQGDIGSQGDQGETGAGTQGNQGNQGDVGPICALDDLTDVEAPSPNTGDVLTYNPGIGWYPDTISGSQGPQGDQGTLYPWEGPWLDATAYALNDCVENDGSGYVCTQAHTSDQVNDEPGVGTNWTDYWDLLVERGPQGFQGNQGNQGGQGSQGNQGNQGEVGEGTQGNQGDQGSQGDQGDQGNQGSQGSQGDQGNQGSQGNQGNQGTQGSQGNQGIGLLTGWVSDSDTWVYVSATSFKIIGKDVTARFPKGTKVQFTQTTVKYGWVVPNAAMSGSDTLVTLAANTTYTVANATISANSYSYEDTPQGFPAWKYSGAWVYSANEQSNITDITYTQVNINTEIFDVISDFNTGTYLFTAPISAFYDITGSVKFDEINAATADARALIYVNGAAAVSGVHSLSLTSNRRAVSFTSVSCYVASGQTVGLYGYATTGANTADIEASAVSTYLSIMFRSI